MLNAHDRSEPTDDDLDAPHESAADLLARVKPFAEWLSESSRSNSDIALYRWVVDRLEAGAALELQRGTESRQARGA